jgi:hypothetical protein
MEYREESETITDPLMSAVIRLLQAKDKEELAKNSRIEAEEAVAKLIPGPEKGQKTVEVGGVKVTVERGFNYKSDFVGIKDDWPKASEFPPPLKYRSTCELDVVGYEWLRENDKANFDIVSKHVTVTPKKTSVSIKDTTNE